MVIPVGPARRPARCSRSSRSRPPTEHDQGRPLGHLRRQDRSLRAVHQARRRRDQGDAQPAVRQRHRQGTSGRIGGAHPRRALRRGWRVPDSVARAGYASDRAPRPHLQRRAPDAARDRAARARASSCEPTPFLYLSVGLVAGAVIALQIGIMRIFSVGSWAHFGSLVVSLAMLGFGLTSAVMCVAQGLVRAALAAAWPRPRCCCSVR